MRKLIVTLVAFASIAAPLALAQTYPEKIALPNAFAPEGVEIALGNTFWVGSVQTGAIYVGDLRTGTGRILVPGAATAGTRGATGIEYDRGRLWVAGAGYGTARVYTAKTGALIREYQLATAPTFINDVVVTKTAAFFTDSQKPVLYRIALSKNGAPGALTTIPLTGDYQHVAGQFNLNGIVATANGKTLIAVQSVAKRLFLISPSTGATKAIDIGSYDLANGDGLLLQGKTLYVVQNRNNKVAVFTLSTDLTKATFVRSIADTDFDVPTTIDRAGARIYVVNARFGTATPTDQSYHVVKAG
jgi:sugar lactone lactonase YvrE